MYVSTAQSVLWGTIDKQLLLRLNFVTFYILLRFCLLSITPTHPLGTINKQLFNFWIPYDNLCAKEKGESTGKFVEKSLTLDKNLFFS